MDIYIYYTKKNTSALKLITNLLKTTTAVAKVKVVKIIIIIIICQHKHYCIRVFT